MAQKKRKRDDSFNPFHILIVFLAIIFGFAKGFGDGLKPPPGDRRG